MRIACHKKLYCTGQNDEVKSRRKLNILEKSEIKATENFYDYGNLPYCGIGLLVDSAPPPPRDMMTALCMYLAGCRNRAYNSLYLSGV